MNVAFLLSSSSVLAYCLSENYTIIIQTSTERKNNVLQTQLIVPYTKYNSIVKGYHKGVSQRGKVKSTTNTSMIYGETGRFPLASDINVQIVKYWLKILRMENTSYVKLLLVYNEMFQNPTKLEWIKYMKILLCSSGFSGVWEQQLVHDERKFIKHFEQLCRDMYIQEGFNDIQCSSRCRMYEEIKQVHITDDKPEAYLTININIKVRTSFTKFRLSSQKLLVEQGRWTISKLDYKLRKYTLCNSGDKDS